MDELHVFGLYDNNDDDLVENDGSEKFYFFVIFHSFPLDIQVEKAMKHTFAFCTLPQFKNGMTCA